MPALTTGRLLRSAEALQAQPGFVGHAYDQRGALEVDARASAAAVVAHAAVGGIACSDTMHARASHRALDASVGHVLRDR
jgi:hypothetical protein